MNDHDTLTEDDIRTMPMVGPNGIITCRTNGCNAQFTSFILFEEHLVDLHIE